MAADDVQTMWEIADADADPVSSVGPTLNALTNIAALEKIIADATSPAADMIQPIAEGIKAIAAQQ